MLDDLLKSHKMEVGKMQPELQVRQFLGSYGLKKETYYIKNQKQQEWLNKPMGTYSIVNLPPVLMAQKKELHYYVNHLAKELKSFLGDLSPKSNILVVALGNKNFHADALGLETVKHLLVTRGFKKVGECKQVPTISAFATGVMGVTGIESSNMVMGVVNQLKPDCVVTIDTLCATSFKRLGNSFQVNDGGVVPGGGIQNAQLPISKQNLGVKVISLGVPLVVYAHSFLDNALEELQTNNKFTSEQCKSLTKQMKEFSFNNLIVTPNNIEELVALCGKMLGLALNKALTGFSLNHLQDYLQRM